MKEIIYDYIIVGSGFGGSVSAMRLAEKGYSVLIIEKGKRFRSEDFPKTNWNLKKYLWAPLIKCFGIQKLNFFKDVLVLSGVGVGGGSLVYGNTLLTPPKEFYKNTSWNDYNDWESVLQPHYSRAKQMLGVTKYNKLNFEDEMLRSVAVDMNRGNTFENVEVGVYFGDTEKEVDPYFNGEGPMRKGCTECAGCFVGCRYNAKNTLDKNYLYFAEKFGANIISETEAKKVSFNRLYEVETATVNSIFSKKKKIFRSKGIIFSGGVLGTMKLLLKQKYVYKSLPNLSERLGENLRTNSETICAVASANMKLNNGLAITSVFNADENTHIELCKYSDGSGVMGRLATLAVGKGTPLVRIIKLFFQLLTKPHKLFKYIFNRDFAKNSVFILVMQTLDNSMQMILKKSIFGTHLSMKNKSSGKVPAYIEVGQEVMYRYAEKVGGIPLNSTLEIFMDMSTTAHILGGAPIGNNSKEGVVNKYFEVFNYPNMMIVDGSIIQANPGVNPSLTITALAEYAMEKIPQKIN